MRSIRDVVEYKNEAVPEKTAIPAAQLSDEFVPLNLTNREIDALVAFIENALYDPNLSRYEPEALPSGQCFPNADPMSQDDLGCN